MACVVVRYHEIALKGGNRHRFVSRLVSNLREATIGLGVRRAQSLPGRVVLWLDDDAALEEIAARIATTFGVANFSRGVATALDLDAIGAAAVTAATGAGARSFAIATRRADKSFPLTSPEVNAAVGDTVRLATGARVDLEHPELTIAIEILQRSAFVSAGKIAGPGGLPVSISGRVTCLLSGGIDSPVAAHRMMQRGCRVGFVHFHGAPYTDRASRDKARELVAHLTRWQLRSELWLVPFGEIQAEIVARVPRSHRVVLYRRMMLRIASVLGGRGGARALVTGESLGQVASQTLENVEIIAAATPTLILRPLIGMDKAEIIAHAERIGTFATSILPDQDCCSLFVPPHPTTHATAAEVAAAEALLDVPVLVQRGVESGERETFVDAPPGARAPLAAVAVAARRLESTHAIGTHSGSSRAS